MSLPASAKYLVIGAGVHGLSTAWHLAKEQRARGRGARRPASSTRPASARAPRASPAASSATTTTSPRCRELMAANVEVWEQDPEAFSYHPVGYVALGAERAGRRPDRGARAPGADRLPVRPHRRRGRGAPSTCAACSRTGARRACEVVPARAQGRLRQQHGLDARPGGQGEGGRRPARRRRAGDRLRRWTAPARSTTVNTDQGDVAVEQVIVAVGPWVAVALGRCSACPTTLDVRTPDGDVHAEPGDVDVLVPPGGRDRRRPGAALAAGRQSMPPVLHVDSDAPLYDDEGELITDELWGNYFKQDLHGVQGGAAPVDRRRASSTSTRTRPRASSRRFADMWCASLSHCMKRFEGKRATYKNVRSGGVGCFTVDSFPVFDYMRPERVRDRRLEPRLQDDRRRPRGGAGDRPAATRACCTRSGTSGSRRATCTRSRTAPIPGADPAAGARAPRRMMAAVTPAASAVRARPAPGPRRARPPTPTSPDAVSARVAAAESAAAPSATAATRQSSTSIPPRAGPRPRPPRNRSCTGATCPATTATRAAAPAPPPAAASAIPTATAPLATSAAKVATAAATPSRRPTLRAPVEPVTCARRSSPVMSRTT